MSLASLKRGRLGQAPVLSHSAYVRQKSQRALARGRAVMLARRMPGAVATWRRAPRVGLFSEVKNVDQVYGPTAIMLNTWAGAEADPAAGVLCIGACGQGAGEHQRDGCRIVVKRIQINGIIDRVVATDQSDFRPGAVVHVALVMDRQTNGAQLNAEDVYRAVTPNVPPARELQFASRFKVLACQTIELHDVAGGTDGANTNSLAGVRIPFRLDVKLNQVVNFVPGAGAVTIADFRDVSFHVICSREGVVGSTGDSLSYFARTRYIG